MSKNMCKDIILNFIIIINIILLKTCKGAPS